MDEEGISKAKLDLDKAELNLVRTYFSNIEKIYLSLGFSGRRTILTNLEYLANGNIAITEQNMVGFNHKTAKALREDAGLTLRDLSDKLGGGRSLVPTLSRYENGRIELSPAKSKHAKNYLMFLKSLGYNPFGL